MSAAFLLFALLPVASCLRGVRQFLQAIELATLFGYFRTTLYFRLFACKFGFSCSYNFVPLFICMQVWSFIFVQLCTFVYLHASLYFYFVTTLYLCLFACKFGLSFSVQLCTFVYLHASLYFYFVTTLYLSISIQVYILFLKLQLCNKRSRPLEIVVISK